MNVKTRYEDHAEQYPDDPDYAALDQGAVSTAARHTAAIEVYTGGKVLDYGCGTGLLMNLFAGVKRPDLYVGVDIIDRWEQVYERARGHRIPAYCELVNVDGLNEQLIELISFFKPDFLAMIGVLGFPETGSGYETVMQAVTVPLRHDVRSGCITLACTGGTSDEYDYMEFTDPDEIDRAVSSLSLVFDSYSISWKYTKNSSDKPHEAAIQWHLK